MTATPLKVSNKPFENWDQKKYEAYFTERQRQRVEPMLKNLVNDKGELDPFQVARALTELEERLHCAWMEIEASKGID